MNLADIVKQLDACDFECEAGPLRNNVAFLTLKEMAGIGYPILSEAGMNHLHFLPSPDSKPIKWATFSPCYLAPVLIEQLVAHESGTFRLDLDAAKDSPTGRAVWATVERLPPDVVVSFRETERGGSVLSLRIPRQPTKNGGEG